jgi:hypothetical protein
MPGIPRSNGCINCRERKIRVSTSLFCLEVKTNSDSAQCDQTKPACARCTSTNRCCKGYRKKETIFINCAAPEEPKRRRSPIEPHIRSRKLSTATASSRVYPSPVSDFQDQFVSLFPEDYHHKPQNGTFAFHQQQPLWEEASPKATNKSNTLSESLTAVNLAMVDRVSPGERMAKQPFGMFGADSPPTNNTLSSMLASSPYWQRTDRLAMVSFLPAADVASTNSGRSMMHWHVANQFFLLARSGNKLKSRTPH